MRVRHFDATLGVLLGIAVAGCEDSGTVGDECRRNEDCATDYCLATKCAPTPVRTGATPSAPAQLTTAPDAAVSWTDTPRGG